MKSNRVVRLTILVLAVLVALALVVGCGGEGATPTVTPVPSPTIVATAEPTPTTAPSPTVVPDTISLGERAWETTLMLAEELSPRESATEQELEAAEWLSGEFSGWGYEVGLEEFEAIELFAAVSLTITVPEESGGGRIFLGRQPGEEVWMFAFPVDPSTRGAEGYQVEGILAYAGQGTEEDFSGVDLKGKIALIEMGGDITIEEKVEGAAESGAEAVALFSEGVAWDRLYDDTDIPVISVGPQEGMGLAQIVESGVEVEARVNKEAIELRPSRNVIAELNNDIEDDDVLVVGAHYDTTPGTQGANDNGSGVAVALTLAEELSDDELPFDLRFVLFGAEEIGLNGSFAYVGGLEEEELDRMMAMINLDVVGTGELTAIGSENMVKFAVESGEGIGIDVLTFELPPGYASDHVPFMLAGVESVFLFADDVTYINSPRDRVEHLEYEPIAHAVELALEVIEGLMGQ